MKFLKIIPALLLYVVFINSVDGQVQPYHDQYRPQVHFSPQAHWMNDPNGMIYFNHTYHLFYQYFPGATVWGPMHWGHAESKDLIHWKQLPTALFPDSLGYIFSGSAVADSNNTSGFGKGGKIPLVAIFTHHDPKGEKEGKNNYQNESLAYSNDNGTTWTKYTGNPVLHNPGIKDFRDPKVMWYAPEKKWVMTLATKDDISFYSSTDLKAWKKESEFGRESGAHGGVWECPDLFPLTLDGKKYWVLIVNINPGGPNGGSATQYFVGQFDGNKFTAADGKTRWLDYGPDEYAGVTWNNTGARKIFLGWMSNWEYATQVPTKAWRSANTLPRDLQLKEINGELLVASVFVPELKTIEGAKAKHYQNVMIKGNFTVGKTMPAPYIVKLRTADMKSFNLDLSSSRGDKVIVGYDERKRQYFIDRRQSGVTGFNKKFADRFTAPRFADTRNADLTLVVDEASVELFADDGLTVMTAIYFPKTPLDHLSIQSDTKFKIGSLDIKQLESIWK